MRLKKGRAALKWPVMGTMPEASEEEVSLARRSEAIVDANEEEEEEEELDGIEKVEVEVDGIEKEAEGVEEVEEVEEVEIGEVSGRTVFVDDVGGVGWKGDRRGRASES